MLRRVLEQVGCRERLAVWTREEHDGERFVLLDNESGEEHRNWSTVLCFCSELSNISIRCCRELMFAWVARLALSVNPAT